MSKAGFSLFVFGLYMLFVAELGFMLVPDILSNAFGLSVGHDFWMRVVGLLASIIGAYYILAARAGMEGFYLWTVPARYYAAAFLLLMFVLGKIESGVLLLAAVDAAGATWTWIALRSDKNQEPA